MTQTIDDVVTQLSIPDTAGAWQQTRLAVGATLRFSCSNAFASWYAMRSLTMRWISAWRA
jgi:hypothetical protein